MSGAGIAVSPARPQPPPVYAIADVDALAPRPLPAVAAALAAAGIRWIQVRAKRLADAELYPLVEATVRALEGSGAALWIDDRADLAALFPVAGVHLGQRDLPPGAARGVVGEGVWVGRSTHDRAELAAAAADPDVDVVAVGPIFPTTGKERPDPVVGLDFLRFARAATAKPLVAIGGIDAGNLAAVLAAGADGAAVLGAVSAGDPAAAAERLLAAAGAGRAAEG
jgi:thiamine-phosphate pyrophosphorylase